MTDTKYYVGTGGVFLGSYDQGNPDIPSGAVEVATPPNNANQVWNGTAWVYTKAALYDYLANYRYEKEVGGIVFNTVPIRTDDRSKMLLASIQKEIDDLANPTHTRSVKTSSGFLTLDDATLSALYVAVIAHVQKCFDSEELIITDITNDVVTNIAELEAAFDAQFAAL